jgi:hypothetical protein
MELYITRVVRMKKEIIRLNVSDARDKLTQLDKLLKPGQTLEITRRGKGYARIELLGEIDPYEEVLKAIEDLPEPEEGLQLVARNYKALLYGMNDGDTDRL